MKNQKATFTSSEKKSRSEVGISRGGSEYFAQNRSKLVSLPRTPPRIDIEGSDDGSGYSVTYPDVERRKKEFTKLFNEFDIRSAVGKDTCFEEKKLTEGRKRKECKEEEDAGERNDEKMAKGMKERGIKEVGDPQKRDEPEGGEIKEVEDPAEIKQKLIKQIYDEVLVVDNVSKAKEVVALLTTKYRDHIHACDTEASSLF